MKYFRLKIGDYGLDYDVDYGINNRRGWSSHYKGYYVYELGSFFRAVWMLGRSLKDSEMREALGDESS